MELERVPLQQRNQLVAIAQQERLLLEKHCNWNLSHDRARSRKTRPDCSRGAG
jgi:hypothetical protein